MLNPKRPKFSAYLSIYNDWDILLPALNSMARYVDELVVVDGAYEWMVPYLEGIGSNPIRSDERVYDAIKASGIPYRVINQTWTNEVEKRRAGYDACSHRYIYRIDADEIVFMDDVRLKSFIAGGVAVAEMQMPLYAAPGWIVHVKRAEKLGCQCFLFDREKVSSDIHLNYLWLVLTADDLPMAGQRPFPVFDQPVAFTAHLTNWRTPETAVNRAGFYIMNWMRQNGIPWIPEMAGIPVTDFRKVFDKISAVDFRSSMLRSIFSAGTRSLEPNEERIRTPLSDAEENTFAGLYQPFRSGLVAQNREASSKRQFVMNGESVLIDITDDVARRALAPHQKITISFSTPLSSAQIKVHTLATLQPMYEASDVMALVTSNTLSFELPSLPDPLHGMLRQVLEMKCTSAEDQPLYPYVVNN